MKIKKLVIILCLLVVIESIFLIVNIVNKHNDNVNTEYVFTNKSVLKDAINFTLGITGDDLVRIKDFYYGTKKVMIDGEYEQRSTTLILLDNGNFNLVYNGVTPYGYFGYYEIENNTIVLNTLYSHGSGCGIEEKSETIKYKILNGSEIQNKKQGYKLKKEFSHEGDFMDNKYNVCTEVVDDALELYDMGYHVTYSTINHEYIFDGGIRERYIKYENNW